MENPGLVTFRDEFVFRSAVTVTERQTRAMVIAHEMAHMWFGDLVTLRWWDDIWLNESFAEYMGYQTVNEACSDLFPDTWIDFGVTRKAWGYEADQRPSTHPVAPDPEAVPDTASALLNFDGISYAKGASALRQLVTWLGEKDFLAGINIHFARHKFGNATLADFIDNLAAATDRDVHAWAERWLRTTGVDTSPPPRRRGPPLEPHGRPRRQPPPPHLRRPLRPRPSGDLVLRERRELDVPQDAPAELTGLAPPSSSSTTRTSPTPSSASTRSPGSPPCAASPASPTRSPAPSSGTLRDRVRDGDLAPADYLEVALAHLPEETELALVQGVLAFARHQIADRYVPAGERPAALATICGIARALLRRTEDGEAPGLRLTAVRAFVDSATTPDKIASWLDEGTVHGGPELDPELRWRILARLAVLGATDETAIAAELERDPSATGQEGAARCRAALPAPEAKEAAWSALFDSDDLSNYLFTATAQGFWQPEQADLVREYVPRFYEAAAASATGAAPPWPRPPAATPSRPTRSTPTPWPSANATWPTPP